MEEEVKGSSSTSTSTSISSFRWNPTKEQVGILEGIYREGIRTPNTEQIQEITRRLRAFGDIQGKNVFYWFQNHKARQRQKLKQEYQERQLAILTRLRRRRHHPPPPPPQQILPPLSAPFYPQTRPNVVYAPCGIPMVAQAAGAAPAPAPAPGFYYQTPPTPNVYFPGPICGVMLKHASNGAAADANNNSVAPQETLLQLFPLQPSAGTVLQEERSVEEEGEGSSTTTETIPFFNFFGPTPNSQGN